MDRRSLAIALGCGCAGSRDDSARDRDADADTDTDTDSDSDTDTDTDTDSDSDTDTDTDSDTDVFLHAAGTFDGAKFAIDCGAGIGSLCEWVDGANLLVAGCGDYTIPPVGDFISLILFDPEEGEVTTCSGASYVQVGFGKDGLYNCAKGGASTYSLNTTELTPTETGGGRIWGGTFAMVADDGTHWADVSGSFRLGCASTGGGAK